MAVGESRAQNEVSIVINKHKAIQYLKYVKQNYHTANSGFLHGILKCFDMKYD